MAFSLLAAALACVAPSGVPAYPQYFDCPFDCMDALSPGDSFDHMGIPSYGPGPVGDSCEISCPDVPNAGYLDGVEYTVVVSSSMQLGQKVACNDQGKFTSDEAFTGSPVVTASYTWRPEGSGDVVFRAICSTKGGTAWIADSLSIKRDSAQGPAPVPPPPTPPTPPSPTPEGSGQDLGGIGELQWTVDGESIEFSVTANRDTWIGFGLSAGDAVSMVGNGDGADVVACHGDPPQVQRFWVTERSLSLSDGVDVAGAKCTRASGVSTLTFQRPLAAAGNMRAVTLGELQPIIWAFGAEGSTQLAYHGSTRGGLSIDFKSGQAAAATKKSGTWALFLHGTFMSISWGGLLPWGVAIASRGRTVSGAPAGAWFKRHRTLQVTGLVVMLLGFIFAIVHVAQYSSPFASPHTWIGLVVVILGCLQPLNAFVRPHPPQKGEARTTARLAFEIVHKGSGWSAVILGMMNVLFGVMMASELDYDNTFVAYVATLAFLGIVPVVCFFVLATFSENNPISTACLAGDQLEAVDGLDLSTAGTSIHDGVELVGSETAGEPQA